MILHHSYGDVRNSLVDVFSLGSNRWVSSLVGWLDSWHPNDGDESVGSQRSVA